MSPLRLRSRKATQPDPAGDLAEATEVQSVATQTRKPSRKADSSQTHEAIDAPESDADEVADASPALVSPQRPLARAENARSNKAAGVLATAKRIRAQRPDDHLSSVLAELRELNISRRDPGRYYATKDIVAGIGTSILAAESKKRGDGFYFPDVASGRYSLGHVSAIRYLAKLIRPTTTAVMELGSGWSSNLFQVYIAHGKTRSRKIIYYGGEDTREGQICAKFLAATDPGLAYRSFQFDFTKPNVEFLQRQRGHILLFTSHAIEQHEFINPELFAQLRNIPNPVTVVHFEPIGWQRDPELVRSRDANDHRFFEGLGARALAGDTSSLIANAAWWSWRSEYNVNLLGIIKGLQRQKAIDLKRIEYDFSGSSNVFNPTTLIHYEFVR